MSVAWQRYRSVSIREQLLAAVDSSGSLSPKAFASKSAARRRPSPGTQRHRSGVGPRDRPNTARTADHLPFKARMRPDPRSTLRRPAPEVTRPQRLARTLRVRRHPSRLARGTGGTGRPRPSHMSSTDIKHEMARQGRVSRRHPGGDWPRPAIPHRATVVGSGQAGGGGDGVLDRGLVPARPGDRGRGAGHPGSDPHGGAPGRDRGHRHRGARRRHLHQRVGRSRRVDDGAARGSTSNSSFTATLNDSPGFRPTAPAADTCAASNVPFTASPTSARPASPSCPGPRSRSCRRPSPGRRRPRRWSP